MVRIYCLMVCAAFAVPALGASKVIVMDLEAKGVDADVADTIGALLVTRLDVEGAFEIVSGKDLENIVALEGEKAAVGCDDAGSCLAEVAGALGADHAVFGSVGKLGNVFVITVSFVEPSSAKVIAREVTEARTLDEARRGGPFGRRALL